jgi:alpha-glucosidase (family GH31 glycosyl hydrolase)
MRYALLIFIFIFASSAVFARADYRVEGNDIFITLDGFGVKSKYMKVEIWSDNMVRIVSTMNDEFSEPGFYLFERASADLKIRVAHVQNNIEIKTNSLVINIAENGLVRLMDNKGRRLLVESDRSCEEIFHADNKSSIVQSFFLARNEKIYGAGQNPDIESYNIRGQAIEMKQSNISVFTPIIYSDKAYAFIWDNYSAGKLNDSLACLRFESQLADDISYFFISAENWDGIAKEIRAVSGKTQLLPQWAFGHILNPIACNTGQKPEDIYLQYTSAGIKTEKQNPDYEFFAKEHELMEKVDDEHPLINAYSYIHVREEYKQAIDSDSTKRFVIPTRINLPGIQQYGAYSISADVEGNWEAFANQISAGITSGLSGQPYWATIPGGSKRDAAINESSYRELMVRWYQFAAFNPILQSVAYSPGAWFFDPENDESRAIAKAVELRYMLAPYVYSTAANVVNNNESFMSSLMFDYINDPKVFDVNDQFLFGKSLMVCPVTKQGSRSREVYLPSGTEWFNFDTGLKLSGGKKISTKAELDRIPVFVKAGSIIPLQVPFVSDDAGAPETITEIRVYAGYDCQFALYQDEGIGNGYKTGQSSVILFDYSERRGTLTINSIEGTYPGMPAEQIFKVVFINDSEGEPVDEQIVKYQGKRVRMKF